MNESILLTELDKIVHLINFTLTINILTKVTFRDFQHTVWVDSLSQNILDPLEM